MSIVNFDFGEIKEIVMKSTLNKRDQKHMDKIFNKYGLLYFTISPIEPLKR